MLDSVMVEAALSGRKIPAALYLLCVTTDTDSPPLIMQDSIDFSTISSIALYKNMPAAEILSAQTPSTNSYAIYIDPALALQMSLFLLPGSVTLPLPHEVCCAGYSELLCRIRLTIRDTPMGGYDVLPYYYDSDTDDWVYEILHEPSSLTHGAESRRDNEHHGEVNIRDKSKFSRDMYRRD